MAIASASVLETHERGNRTENLLARDAMARLAPRTRSPPKRAAGVRAAGMRGRAAGQRARALVRRRSRSTRLIFSNCSAQRNSADVRLRIFGIADAQPFGAFDERCDETIVDRRLQQASANALRTSVPRCSRSRTARRRPPRRRRRRRRRPTAIFRRVPSVTRLSVRAARRRDELAGRGAAGEGNFVDAADARRATGRVRASSP